MATKKRAKKSDPAPLPSRLPPPELDPEEGVDIVRLWSGRAAFMPGWVRGLPPEAQALASVTQETVAEVSELLERVDSCARSLRDDYGLSYERLGWLLGMSGEGVRRRLASDG